MANCMLIIVGDQKAIILLIAEYKSTTINVEKKVFHMVQPLST